MPGFSFDSKPAVPDYHFWAGSPIFQAILTTLDSGTPILKENQYTFRTYVDLLSCSSLSK